MRINELVKDALNDKKVSAEDIHVALHALECYYEATTTVEEREHLLRVSCFLDNIAPLARLNDKAPKWENTCNDFDIKYNPKHD